MNNKNKAILSFVAIAMMFAVAFVGFTVIADDGSDATDTSDVTMTFKGTVKVGDSTIENDFAKAVEQAKKSADKTIVFTSDSPKFNKTGTYKDNADWKYYDVSGLTIDLNSKDVTIERKMALVLGGSNFTIKNGTITAAGDISYALFVGTALGTTTNATLQNITFPNGGINISYATNVILDELSENTAVGKTYYSVWCNENTTITIRDGTYSSPGYAVLGGYTSASMQILGGTYKVLPDKPLILGTNGAKDFQMPTVIKGGFFYQESTGTKTVQLADELQKYVSDLYCVAKATATIDGKQQTGYRVMLISEAEAKIGNLYYATFEDAIAAVQTDETIDVLNDVTVSETIEIADGRDFTIDLNLFTLTYSPTTGNENSSLFDIGKSGDASSASTVRITDGGIVANAFTSGTYSLIYVYDGATLELDTVNITTTGSALFPVGEATKVSVVDCDINAGVYCVATNAGDTKNGGVVIEIIGSQLKSNGYKQTAGAWDSDDCPVLINVPCTLTIKDSELTGNRQGLVVRAGTATVEDTIINYIPTFVPTAKQDYESKAWGSGNEVPMGAIVVGNHSTGTGYDKDRSLTIKNVTVNIIDGTTESKNVNLIYADLNKDRSNTDTCIIKIEGGFAYNTYADSKKTVNSNINALAKIKDNVSFDKKFSVSNFAELRAAATIGGEITLTDNIEMTMDVNISGDTVLDTAGYSITIGKGITLNLASGSVVTGKIAGPNSNVMTVSGMKAGDDGIAITGGSLIIKGKIVQDSGTYSGVTVTVSGDSITIAGTLDEGATMVVEKDTSVTIAEESEFASNGTITNNGIITNQGTITNNGSIVNNGTLKVTDGSTVTGNSIVNSGIVADKRTSGDAVPIDTTSTGKIVVTEDNASAYEGSSTKIIIETDKITTGTVTSDTNEYVFVDAVTTTGDLKVVMNEDYRQYTITIPKGTSISAGTIISVVYDSSKTTSNSMSYEITTSGITEFGVKVPTLKGFKSAKVLCDGIEAGVSNVKYNSTTGFVTFDAGHNSTFSITLSYADSSSTDSGSSSDGGMDRNTMFVAATVLLVISILALSVVIKRK